MASEEGKSERGFTVIDRRGSRGEEERPPGEKGAAEEVGRELPAVDFSTFVLSLGTSALYHLGVAAHPESGEQAPEPNLPLARQTIDILAMLEAKTRGNLEEREARLLESVLYELRMRFVEAGK